MASVVIDEAAVYDLLNSPDGPVGLLMEEMAIKATAIAEALAPTQKPQNHSWQFMKSTSYQPWSTLFLKANIRPHVGYTKSGTIFGGVDAPFGPTLFLEHGAVNWKTRRPNDLNKFLTEALETVGL